MDVHNLSPSSPYVLNYFSFFFNADIFILWYNGPASLDSPGSVTKGQPGYCLNHQCKWIFILNGLENSENEWTGAIH